MRAALLLSSDSMIPVWQFNALKTAIDTGLEITTVLHCTNDHSPPKKMSRAAYYALALSGRRTMPMVRSVNATSLLPEEVRTIRFASEWEGAWQRIPAEISSQLSGIDVIVKFGMNLLRDPENIPATHGVLSYHHGDPEVHRGRPAGFYELKSGEPVMGIIVQRLTNTLDGGSVLAKGYSRVVPTSYKQTLNDAFDVGVPLLAQAIESSKIGRSFPLGELGPNHTLPSNREVISAVAGMAFSSVRRLIYGAAREKRWKVAFVSEKFNPDNPIIPARADFRTISLPEGYSFAADPAGESRGRLFCEVMNARTGKGQIAVFDGDAWSPVVLPVDGGHLSYPQVVDHSGATYLFPEMAEVGPPSLFELDGETLTYKATYPLIGLENERLVDGTLFPHDGHWYLFGGRSENGNVRLDLWVADDLMGPYSCHPDSPICLDPRRARMAGPLVRRSGRLYRLGQDGSVGYGQGIMINRVDELTPTQYSESSLGSFLFEDVLGPHTVLPTENGYWLDYYTEKWTPLAGFRRLMALVR